MKEARSLLCLNFVTWRGKLGELSEKKYPQRDSNREKEK
jgi:hypothetical protein